MTEHRVKLVDLDAAIMAVEIRLTAGHFVDAVDVYAVRRAFDQLRADEPADPPITCRQAVLRNDGHLVPCGEPTPCKYGHQATAPNLGGGSLECVHTDAARCARCGWRVGDYAITRQPYDGMTPDQVRVRIVAPAGGSVWIVRNVGRLADAGWCVSAHELQNASEPVQPTTKPSGPDEQERFLLTWTDWPE